MPDIEDLAPYYFTPIIAPTPIDTRLPKPDDNADTINGFVTVEAAPAQRVGLAQWDLSFILHAYSPVEYQAADISHKLMSYGTAAQGQTIAGWYVVMVPIAVGGEKLVNPDIELPRYRSALTWRVQGHPI
jgi:hypothetical protein